jgi:hypothetical protein
VPQTSPIDAQLETLLALGYPGLAGLEEAAFALLLEPLRDVAAQLPQAASRPPADSREGVPVLLVVQPALVPSGAAVEKLRLADGDRPGIVDPNHGPQGIEPYLPVVAVPGGRAYLALDVVRGEEFRGVRPRDAVLTLTEQGRTPLTIAEGIALVTHFPELLTRNHCFMLAGSRRGDRRVPALWVSAKAPKLGWCWEGNPHSWLGTASTSGRVGSHPGVLTMLHAARSR